MGGDERRASATPPSRPRPTADGGVHDMSTMLLPVQFARLPWTLIGVVLAIGTFGGHVPVLGRGRLAHARGRCRTSSAFAVFLGMAVAMSYIKPDTYRDFSWPAYGAVILLLIVTLVIGHGRRRRQKLA
jgi:rod shape determining protein RodA